jgi:hypothetical protein
VRKVGALLAIGASLSIATIAFSGHALAATTSVDCSAADLGTAISHAAAGDTLSLAAGCTYSMNSAWQPSVALTIDGNGATIDGNNGGFSFLYFPSSAITIDDLTVENFEGTSEGAGIETTAGLTIEDSTFADNWSNASGGAGGAVAELGDGPVLITGSTFYGNLVNYESELAGDGGALYSVAPTTIINSTFFDNEADQGGALAVAAATVINSTIKGNVATSGGGIFTGTYLGSGGATVENTIVSDDLGGNCSGSITDGGYNDENGAGQSCGFSVHNQTGDPGLAGLAGNGGSTETMAITTSSAAYHTGSPSICAAALPSGAGGVDQRGDPRGTTACDIGAYELQAPAVGTPTPTAGTVPVPATGSAVGSTRPAGLGPVLGLALLLAGAGIVLAVASRRRHHGLTP